MHEGPVSARLGLRGWPREAEDIIVARDLLLAEATGARYHIAHVSSLGAIRLLREAKSRGVRVTAEVTPHHLALTDEAVIGYDTACKVNPPLRSAADRAALREALRDGTIDCIATDHAPHDPNEKRCEYEAASNGIIGLETALPVLLDLVRAEVLTPLALAERLATGPARILPELGCGALRPGDRADITVVDPTMKWTVTTAALRSKSHNTPWLDKELTGAVLYTIVGGDVIYARGGAA